MGPLLFLFYINDLPSHKRDNSSVILFTDDTTISVNSSDLNLLQLCMNQALSMTVDWFNTNKLKLNTGKTSKLIFTTKNVEIDQLGKSARFLGVTLDSGLTWDQHVHGLAERLCKVVYLLKTLRKEVTDKVLVTAYY